MAAGIYSLQGGSGQQGLAAVQLHLYAGLKVNILQINRHSVFQDSVIMSNDGALDAAAIGERSAGQGCPLIGIQIEFHSVLFVVIHKQDSLVGDNIVLGSPAGQRPGAIFAFGGDAAGHEGIILTNIQDARLQSGSGQQSIAAVQFNRNALSEGNILQFNGNSILSNDGAINAAAWFSRQRSDWQ